MRKHTALFITSIALAVVGAPYLCLAGDEAFVQQVSTNSYDLTVIHQIGGTNDKVTAKQESVNSNNLYVSQDQNNWSFGQPNPSSPATWAYAQREIQPKLFYPSQPGSKSELILKQYGDNILVGADNNGMVIKNSQAIQDSYNGSNLLVANQSGSGNVAGLYQKAGKDNQAYITQDGNQNELGVWQDGSTQGLGLLRPKTNTLNAGKEDVHIDSFNKSLSNKSGQFGTNNKANLVQTTPDVLASNTANISQEGTGNRLCGVNNSIGVSPTVDTGSAAKQATGLGGNLLNLIQLGEGNQAGLYQGSLGVDFSLTANSNVANIYQSGSDVTAIYQGAGWGTNSITVIQ